MTMTRTDITHGVAALLEEIAGVKASEVTDNARFREDFDIDSLSMVELVVGAEEKFGIRIPDEQTQSFATVEDLVNQIAKLQHAVKA